MELATFDRAVVRQFADLAAEGLSAAREEIDALNVYPVPDGDTGTNMFLTVEAAREALCDRFEQHPDEDPTALRGDLAAYSRAALLGARGNSGVILSQLIGALFRRMAQAGPDDRSSAVFAAGLKAASDAAYAAVGKPVEGTMLTVARVAAEAAARAAEDPDARLAEVVVAASAAAHTALDRTPDQLAVLRDAGVVDAGGRGLCVIFEAAEIALTGKHPVEVAGDLGTRAIPQPHLAEVPTGDLTEEGPGYEVMYLLDADDDAIGPLREKLGGLGDSLVVVGGEGLWNVHVHTDDVGAAVEAGLGAGAPRRIRVTHFADQVARARARRERRTGRAVVAVAAGSGLARVFGEAGATVIEGSSRRPSTRELLDAIESTGAAEVIVLPNHPDSLGVAQAAAHAAEETGEVHVVVIPTRAQVQGIAALAVHEPARALDADVVSMTAGARGARHGAVTIAAKKAITTAGECEPGDVLGALQGDFAVVGKDQFEVARELLQLLLSTGGELVTLVGGEEAGDLPARCESWVEQAYPGVDVVVYDGGQARYPLLLAVE